MAGQAHPILYPNGRTQADSLAKPVIPAGGHATKQAQVTQLVKPLPTGALSASSIPGSDLAPSHRNVSISKCCSKTASSPYPQHSSSLIP